MKNKTRLSLHALIIYRDTFSEFVLAGYSGAQRLNKKNPKMDENMEILRHNKSETMMNYRIQM